MSNKDMAFERPKPDTKPGYLVSWPLGYKASYHGWPNISTFESIYSMQIDFQLT